MSISLSVLYRTISIGRNILNEGDISTQTHQFPHGLINESFTVNIEPSAFTVGQPNPTGPLQRHRVLWTVISPPCICNLEQRKLTGLSHRSRVMSPGGSISFKIVCNRCRNQDYLSWNPIIQEALLRWEAFQAVNVLHALYEFCRTRSPVLCCRIISGLLIFAYSTSATCSTVRDSLFYCISGCHSRRYDMIFRDFLTSFPTSD